MDVVLTLNERLKGKEIRWALGGDLGEALRTVHVEPTCVEIITDENGFGIIFEEVKEYNPENVGFITETLTRRAIIGGKKYPLAIRSHFFGFLINSVEVKVYSDIQFQIADWGWGDKVEVDPEYVLIGGQRIAVMPLHIKLELYKGLGWIDRAEKVTRVLNQKLLRRPQ